MSGEPSRRDTLHLLSSVSAASLAGCITGNPSLRDSGETARPTTENTTTDQEHGLSFSAEVVQSFTQDHPGRIMIELTNERPEPLAMGIFNGVEGPMSSIEGNRTDGNGQLVIFADPPGNSHETPAGVPCRSDEYAIPETPNEDCWQPACEYSKMHNDYAITVPAEGTLSWPYVVLDGFNKTCLPAGMYEFVETTPISSHQNATVAGTTPEEGWSTTITKRLQLTLESNGALSAEAYLQTNT